MKKLTGFIIAPLLFVAMLVGTNTASAAPKSPAITSFGHCTNSLDTLQFSAVKWPGHRIRLISRLTIPDNQYDDNWIVLKWRYWPVYSDLYANYSITGPDFLPYLRSLNRWTESEFTHDYSGWDRYILLAIDGTTGAWCKASVSIH